MIQQEFLEKMSALLAEYEESNDNWPVGCYLSLWDSPTDSEPITHEWDGEKFALVSDVTVITHTP